jgi:flagellar hook assembly protein FlgD
VKTVVVTLNDKANVPKVFALSQNYPNPFNPVTHFSVDVPRTSEVEIAVFDLLGRKITTLLTGEQPAGSIGIEWDGRDGNSLSVPSGVYFVRMNAKADGFSTVRKIMLMK